MDWSNSNIRGFSFKDKELTGAKFTRAHCGLKPYLVSMLIGISLIFALLSGCVFQLGIASVISDPNSRPVYSIAVITLLSVFFISISAKSLVTATLVSFLAAILSVLVSSLLFLSAYAIESKAVNEILAGALAGIIIIAVVNLGIIVLAITGDIATILSKDWVILGIAFFSILGIWMALGIHTSHAESVIGTAISLIATLTSCCVATKAEFGSKKAPFIRRISLALVTLVGTSFKGANLTSADFAKAVLNNTDFRDANLTRVYWHGAKGLEFARLGKTYLANPKIRQLVVSCDGRGQNFDGLGLTGVNLQDTNLQDASFVGASLNQSNLRGADLSRAILKQTQLEGADLTGATLTGACIEDWGITSTTELESVQCEYVFMRLETKDNPNRLRKPDNWRETFAEGEFADFIQPFFDTLDLYHSQDVDPRAISIALKNLSVNHPEENLQFVAIERRGNNGLNLRFTTTPRANKSELSHEYFANYAQIKKELPVTVQMQLAAQDAEICTLKGTIEQFIQTGTHRSTIQAETIQVIQGELVVTENRGININAGDNANIGGLSSGDGIVNLGTISGNVTNAINQLPDSSEPNQQSLKTLLTQLQQVIEADTDLPAPDKADLLEQVQSLAEAKQSEEPEKREGLTRKAMKMFDATLKSLPDTAKIVEACSKLLPLILKALGFPA